MNVVPPPPVNLEAIPAALRNRPQWVVWKVEDREGKETKAPYQAREPFKRASSTQPGTWATFEEAVHAFETHCDDAAYPVAGLGFVFTKNDPFTGVDVDPDLEPVVQRDIIKRLASYTERSPSGEGYHVIVEAELDGKGRHPPGIGVFTEGRYFTVTGNHVVGTPDTVEKRQSELEAVMDEYLPVVALPNSYSNGNGVHPVDLEDEALLEKARVSRKGADFADLYAGRWEGKYSSQSEADLAFCSKLAFWTGRDGARIDRIFRSSGLMRDKWEREDYRTRTLEEAIAGCRDVYVLKRERYEKDELHDAPADAPDTAPLMLKIVTWGEFAAVKEPSREPILGAATGDEHASIALSKGGMMIFYGKGGAGKTTLEVDLIAHLGAGREWLGLAVNGRPRILVIENEGPRGMFRDKIDAKLRSWDGDDSIRDHVLQLEEPWALFDFTHEGYREQLRLAIEQLEIDIIAAGPIQALGMKGGGTPDEVGTFVNAIELVRAQAARDVAFIFAHHDNKAGEVSGAWGGRPDSLVHVAANDGGGSTRVFWEKARWGPAIHRQHWQANWRSGATFELDSGRPVFSDSTIEEEIIAFIAENPGCAWRAVLDSLTGRPERAAAIRDRLEEAGKIENRGAKGRHAWYVAFPAFPPSGNQGLWDSETLTGNEDPSDGAHSVSAPPIHPRRGWGVGNASAAEGQSDGTDDIDFGGRDA